MQVVLVLFRADGERRSFAVARDVTVIGRREDCDLRIPLGEVSRKHCRLIREENNLRFEDFGSANGTYHNGRRAAEGWLKAGDSLQVGPVVFVVQIDGLPAEGDLQPITNKGATSAATPPPLAARPPVAAPQAPASAPDVSGEDELAILPDEQTIDEGGIPTGLDRSPEAQSDDLDFQLDDNSNQS